MRTLWMLTGGLVLLVLSVALLVIVTGEAPCRSCGRWKRRGVRPCPYCAAP